MTNNQTLSLDLITIDNSLNPRVGALDQEKVVEYKEHLDRLPPMDVFEVDGGYILVAGFHRIAAHRLAGRDSAEFVVHQGTREEAAEFADLDNLSHGINLTREEKRSVAERQLCRHPDWADSRIARSCYTTDKTIRKIRKELEAAGRIEVHDRLIGADGVARPRNIERAEPELEARVAGQQAAGSNTPLTDAVSESPGSEVLLEDPDVVAAIDEELEEAGLAEPGVSDVTWSEDGTMATVEVTDGNVAAGLSKLMEAKPPDPDPHTRANAQLDALAGATPLQRAAEMARPIGQPPTPPKPDPEPVTPPPPPPPPPVVSEPPVRISITVQPGPVLDRRAVMLSLAEGDDAEPVTAGVLYRELLPRLQMMLDEHFNPPAAPPPPNVSEAGEGVPEAEPDWLVAK